MYELMTVIRKRPDIPTAAFRDFMENRYGTVYAAMPEVRRYVHFYLDDLVSDGAEEPIDAIVNIAFESRETMQTALATDAYREAVKSRSAYIRESSRGILPALVAKTVRLVP
jgi:hypothetical protein